MYCPNCGAKNDNSNQFCGKCGKPLPASNVGTPLTPPIPVPPLAKTRRRLSGWRLALVIIGSILVGLILLFLAGLAIGWIQIVPVSTETSIPGTTTPQTIAANYQQIASKQFPAFGAVSPKEDVYASENDTNIELYSIPDLGLIRTIQGNGVAISDVAFSPDESMIASVDKDQTVKVWKVSDGKLLQTFTVPGSEEAPGVNFIGNDRVAFMGYFARLMFIWKVSDGSLIQQHDLTRSGNEIFSPDGKLMAEWSLFDQAAYILDLTTGNWLDNSYGSYVNSTVSCGAFSPDSQLLATGSHDYNVQIWNIPEQKQIATLTLDGIVRSVRFSTDGNILYAITKNGKAWIWHWKENQVITSTPTENEYLVFQVSHDANKLAVGTFDNQIQLIDVSSGDILQTLKIESDVSAIGSITFSPDDQILISASPYGLVTIWQNKP